MWEKIKSWVKEHPWYTAGMIFVVGVILIFWFRRGSAAPVVQDNGLSAYYGAAAAATQSGNELQAASLAAQSQTIASNNNLTASLAAIQAQLGIAQSTNQAQTEQTALQVGGATMINQQNSVLAAHAADLASDTANTQGLLSYLNNIGQTFLQGSTATKIAAIQGGVATNTLNPTLVQSALQASDNPNNYQSVLDALVNAAQFARTTSPAISAPASPAGSAANNNQPATTAHLIAAYGYDPRTFNAYG